MQQMHERKTKRKIKDLILLKEKSPSIIGDIMQGKHGGRKKCLKLEEYA